MAKYAICWLEWWPYWKMAAILKFCVARVIFLNKGPKRDTHAKFGACITI